MKLAIHHREGSFSSEWIRYCKEHNIEYKVVSCYSSDIVDEIGDCDALMWHFHQSNPKDLLFAKELLYSLQMAGKKVFPDFNTAWHFDDKVGQKYLLEAMGAPVVPSHVFYDKASALEWVQVTEFPKVFKLRKGSASAHVVLVENRKTAQKLIKKAFSSGFSQYNAMSSLKERWRLYNNHTGGLMSVLKGVVRLVYPTEFSRVAGNERGYIYFQDYISGMDHDIRITVINNRAFASKRGVRKDDFRASGSGKVEYGRNLIPRKALATAFEVNEQLQLQSAAFDIVMQEGKAWILEVSYGFGAEEADLKHGYWDRDLNWHSEPFNRPVALIENLIREIKKDRDVSRL